MSEEYRIGDRQVARLTEKSARELRDETLRRPRGLFRRRSIAWYEPLPWGWGFAWCDYARNRRICYPIPFNLVFRIGRAVYFSIAANQARTWIERREGEAYKAGFEQGKLTGAALGACDRAAAEIGWKR